MNASSFSEAGVEAVGSPDGSLVVDGVELMVEDSSGLMLLLAFDVLSVKIGDAEVLAASVASDVDSAGGDDSESGDEVELGDAVLDESVVDSGVDDAASVVDVPKLVVDGVGSLVVDGVGSLVVDGVGSLVVDGVGSLVADGVDALVVVGVDVLVVVGVDVLVDVGVDALVVDDEL